MIKKPHILICAYACEPNKGSEPEVGWKWAISLAEYYPITVITRSNNEPTILPEIPETKYPLQFEYVEVGSFSLILKRLFKRFHIAKGLYSSAWQRHASRHIKKLNKENKYSITQHITLASYRYPFAVTGHNTISIVGPIGGIEIFPYQLLPKKQLAVLAKEGIRNFFTRSRLINSIIFKRIKKADLVISSTQQMHNECVERGIKSICYPTIGIDASVPGNKVSEGCNKKNDDYLFVGNITYLKGLEILFYAMTKISPEIGLTIIGSTNAESKSLLRLVDTLGLQDRITYLGRMPRNELLEVYKNYKALVFPSMHDSGGFVILEAALAGLPTIAFNHGGPSVLINNNQTGLLCEIGSRDVSIDNLSELLNIYSNDASLSVTHGNNAETYVRENFTWESKARYMSIIYEGLLQDLPDQSE